MDITEIYGFDLGSSQEELGRTCERADFVFNLAGRFEGSEYGRSKLAGEKLFFQYAEEIGAKALVVKKLYSAYLSYLPKSKMSYRFKSNADSRGNFTELLRMPNCGQGSVNVAKPGVTRGQH